jgi:hypothetical protein
VWLAVTVIHVIDLHSYSKCVNSLGDVYRETHSDTNGFNNENYEKKTGFCDAEEHSCIHRKIILMCTGQIMLVIDEINTDYAVTL